MGTFNVGPKLTVLGGARFESYNMNYHAQLTYVEHNVLGNAISTENGSVRDSVNPVITKTMTAFILHITLIPALTMSIEQIIMFSPVCSSNINLMIFRMFGLLIQLVFPVRITQQLFLKWNLKRLL